MPKRALTLTLVIGVFFLGLILFKKDSLLSRFRPPTPAHTVRSYEVFGFAPFWTLSKMDNIDWGTLTTFAYFSLPIMADGSIDKSSYEWTAFNGKKVDSLFEKAKQHEVKRVVTLTQMEKPAIEAFLDNRDAWETLAYDSVEVIKEKNLQGVNIDIEYIPSNSQLRTQFSEFMEVYAGILNKELNDPYITVSVLASSVRFNKIYDIERLAKSTDGVVMMAYDFYYAGSDSIGPSAPLYGYNHGKGPFWYDVSTAIDDFLRVADSGKIIMGIPYYGWNYPAYSSDPKSGRAAWRRVTATTQDKLETNNLLKTTPIGGWDNDAKVGWRAYFDADGWHVVYMEDKISLSYKYDFAKEKQLKGVGLWALGFDSGDSLWKLLKNKFKENSLASNTRAH